jgi:hypothetical protein
MSGVDPQLTGWAERIRTFKRQVDEALGTSAEFSCTAEVFEARSEIAFCEFESFSIGAGWCQALSDCSGDCWLRCHSQGHSLLFGIGTVALHMMGSGGCGGPISRGVLAARRAAGAGFETDSPHPSSLRGHRSTDRRNSGFLLSCSIAPNAMRDGERHKCASTARPLLSARSR